MVRSHYRRQRTLRLAEWLEPRQLLAATDLRITEWMAANRSVLRDDDGDYSDWIEIYNNTDDVQSLQGWSLTDDATKPRQWRLPADTLQPHEYRVIFASGKDRGIDANVWHTNFRLDADQGFLGLVDPRGDIVQSFGSPYPAQTADISYGLPITQASIVASDSPARVHVATSADVGIETQWFDANFNDGNWKAASGGVGFDRRLGYPNVGFEAGDLSNWSSLSETRAVSTDLAIPAPQGTWQGQLFTSETSSARFSVESFLGLERFTLNTLGSGNATRGSALKREFTVAAGTTIEFDWNFLTNEPSLEGQPDFAFMSLAPNGTAIRLAQVQDATNASASEFNRETGYHHFRLTVPTAGTYTLGVGVMNETNRFVSSSLLVDNFLVGGIGQIEDNFGSIIATSVESDLSNRPGSIWLRYPFELPPNHGFHTVQLRLRYDDGFVAYLNGERIAADGLGERPTWNSLSSNDRPDALGREYVTLTLPASMLRAGRNVLAMQAVKSSIDDPNVLAQAELVGLSALRDTPVFFRTPTPGKANIANSFLIAAPVEFSQTRGIYDRPFTLLLSSPTANSVIRYTLDGSLPTETHGEIYREPLTIGATQTVRAIATRSDSIASQPITHSYLFLADVAAQSRATAVARGFPDAWGAFWKDIPPDYEMDPRIVGANGTDQFNGLYAKTLRNDLLALPTMSLVMDRNDLWGSQGIYSDPLQRGIESERRTSLELIYPDGKPGFQLDAGIRIQGGVSRFISSKMSFRLLFKDDYGTSKLEYPLFGPDAASTFDSLSLRSSAGEHLIGIHYIRDEFGRRLQLRTEQLASHGTYVHLYINGLYWGLYNPVERIDGQFAANYLGGTKDEYDVLNAGDLGSEGITAIAGSIDAWNTMMSLARQVDGATSQLDKTNALLRLEGKRPDGTRNQDWEVYLDTDNYIDYLLTQIYMGNRDWPIRNYYMLRRRGPASDGYKFQVWDSEFVLDKGQRNSLLDITTDGPGELFHLLRTSESFRVRVSDRVQKMFGPGGALYVNPEDAEWNPSTPENNVPASIYAELADFVRNPLGPEVARWGDETARNGNLFLRHTEWQNTVDANLRDFFPTRSDTFLTNLRNTNFYRDAPTLLPSDRYVGNGKQIEITSNVVEIYYTTDGTDPRRADGTLSPTATRYRGPISINQRTTIITRARNGSSWTARNEATFVTTAFPADADSLRITELNYNPHPPLADVGEENFDNDEFEFVELTNISNHAVEMAGVRLTGPAGAGIEFVFGEQVVGAGATVIVPKNRLAFRSRYGNSATLAVGATADQELWIYEGRLGNSGETVRLMTAADDLVVEWTYSDTSPWPWRADGWGSSLELVDARKPPTAQNTRASVRVGGSPARTPSSPITTVKINEVLASPVDETGDAIEIINLGTTEVDVSGWFLSDTSNNLRKARLPLGSRIEAGGRLVLREDDLGFGLSANTGETLVLIAADTHELPTDFIDDAQFGASLPGVSLIRWPDGQHPLFPASSLTLGQPNASPRRPELILSEVMVDPADPDGAGPITADAMEYIELTNTTNATWDLSNWRITGDVRWQAPAGTSLAAGQSIVIVSFDPVRDPGLADIFRLTWSTNTTFLPSGPWQGKLGDDSGQLELLQPVATGVVPGDDNTMALTDRVTYATQEPWPSNVSNGSNSLHRRSGLTFGDLPTSWTGRRASPGRSEFPATTAGDLTKDGQLNADDIDRFCAIWKDPAQVTASDLNGDGRVNLADYDLLVEGLLASRAGDANVDGVFDSRDLVLVFTAAEYEDSIVGNSGWRDGDWNCDGEFNSADIVRAFTSGGYLAASEPAPGRTIATVARDLDGSFAADRQELRAIAAAMERTVKMRPASTTTNRVALRSHHSTSMRETRGKADTTQGSLPLRTERESTDDNRLRVKHFQRLLHEYDGEYPPTS